jgi:hypothetical protein
MIDLLVMDEPDAGCVGDKTVAAGQARAIGAEGAGSEA